MNSAVAEAGIAIWRRTATQERRIGACWRRSVAATFAPGDIPAMRSRRKRYDDREVDFADARLVWLSDEHRTQSIATIDFDISETYRLTNGKSFKPLMRRP